MTTSVPPARAVDGGKVYLVGAGPGDPELLTLRALRVLEAAEVCVHDRLIGPGVLECVGAQAERIFVGKMRARHTLDQDAINALLVARARAGLRVVRLKGGDPFLFGRGGEELAALRAAGVPVEIVPGVTAASGCAAAMQIPLTHREHAHSVVFVTGQTKDGLPELDWPSLAKPLVTVVVYMGLAVANEIARRLVAFGRSPATPVAVIENGTLPGERLVVGRLDTIDAQIAAAGIGGPSLLVIGEVAALARSGDDLERRIAGSEAARALDRLLCPGAL